MLTPIQRQPLIKFLAAILFFTLSILIDKDSLANMSEPPSPSRGNITGDSYLKHLTVIREELVINLSGIPEGKPVRVRAKYVIDCPRLLTNVELVFVANNLTESRYRVDLDGEFLNGYLKEYEQVPSNWLPPDSIIWLNNRKIPYSYDHKGLITFRFDFLAQGEHTIHVDYDSDPSEWFTGNDLSVIKTFVYILKPTDNWKSFENFHLVVFTPSGWDFSSNLELERATSYSLSGDWSKLPAQYLSIAIRKPPNQARVYSILFLIGSWLIFISLIIFWMTWVARQRIQKNKSKTIQVLNSILISLLIPIFFFFVYYKNQDLLKYWLNDQLNPTIFHGSGYYILAFPFVWIIAAILTFLVDYFLTKKVKTKLGL